jgi:hypothetical protein
MKKLLNVTLLGIDCVNVERLQKALDISAEYIEFGAVKLLTSLPTDDFRKVEIEHLGSIDEYSKFCIKDLVKYVTTDYVLVVQYDGFVLNPEKWSDEFFQYDYIGAVWPIGPWGGEDFPPELHGKDFVGNGGFSLRSKKFLELSTTLFDSGKILKYQPEDVALCVWYRHLFEAEGFVFAPVSVARKFSYNIKDKDTLWSDEFGFHGLKQKNVSRLSKWIEQNQKWDLSVQ